MHNGDDLLLNFTCQLDNFITAYFYIILKPELCRRCHLCARWRRWGCAVVGGDDGGDAG